MSADHAKLSPRERLHEEVREFLVVFVYLYVCFGAVLMFKAAVLRDAGIAFAPFGMAAIKAAIMAKFILIGQMTPVDRRGTGAPLVWAIVRKSIGFLVLLIALTAVEHLLERWWHGKGLPQSIADLGDVAIPEMLTHSLLMLLVLIPYIAYREIDDALGRGTLWRLMRQPGGVSAPAAMRDRK
jgi:hypothetical protein